MTAILCLVLLSGLPRHDTCHAVAAEAQRQGVPVTVALAVGWQESRMNPDAVSKRGAVGPMQVLSKWHPGDPTEAGIALLRRLYVKHGDWHRALCGYASGVVCRPAGERYARRVAARVLWLQLLTPGGSWPAALNPPRRLM